MSTHTTALLERQLTKTRNDPEALREVLEAFGVSTVFGGVSTGQFLDVFYARKESQRRVG